MGTLISGNGIFSWLRGGKKAFAPDTCEVHHLKLEQKEVPIIYGLLVIRPGEPSQKQVKRLFPHHQQFVGGGCAVSSDDPKTSMVMVCEKCISAYEEWRNAKGK